MPVMRDKTVYAPEYHELAPHPQLVIPVDPAEQPDALPDDVTPMFAVAVAVVPQMVVPGPVPSTGTSLGSSRAWPPDSVQMPAGTPMALVGGDASVGGVLTWTLFPVPSTIRVVEQ